MRCCLGGRVLKAANYRERVVAADSACPPEHWVAAAAPNALYRTFTHGAPNVAHIGMSLHLRLGWAGRSA